MLPIHHLDQGVIIFYINLLRWDELHSFQDSPQKLKAFQDFTSHQILWHMHEALNIDKNKI